ncbi:MAG: molybdopterin oxidoreductase family protein [Deltaproteobacteria bacterium]|nr:MAG: molybdopterin oxidoreductase family protein [Deltaproteobacteria bacterium]
MPRETETRYHQCTICEAACGLELEVSGREVVSIRGDAEDAFSRGFVCPKGAALRELDADPDRLRQPLVRRDGVHVPVSWDEAFEAIDRGLRPIIEQNGQDAVAFYLGNPGAHSTALLLYNQALLTGFRSRNRYSASTVDQYPKQVAVSLVFGGPFSIPVPDIDRSRYLLMLGANPMASNGSLWTVPDFRGRVRRLRERGGRLVVVDPRRSETAAIADEHVMIRPGTDALLLAGMVHTLFAEDLVRPGRLAQWTNGTDEVRRAIAPFAPEQVAPRCGVAAEVIRHLARELAAADAGCVYGRIGTTTTEFGTTTSWLVDVLNVLTGQLDRPGGAMFPKAAAFAANTRGKPGVGAGTRLHRHKTRVRGAPEVLGEFPCACLAEEIETPGGGQVRALITIAGNPAVSTPNAARLSRALATLDFMVSVDLYLNETTRHADVILPGLSPLEQSHFDIAFPQLSVRNWTRYSPPVFEPPRGALEEWQVLLRLLGVLLGQGPKADVDALDALVIGLQVQAAVRAPGSTLEGRNADEILAALDKRRGPDRLVDLALRSGPYGDQFGAKPDGLSLDRLAASPHGIDLGPLAPRIPEVLRTPSGKIELAPALLIEDLDRLEATLERPAPGLLLVGRRHVRSNNSWMHNLPMLAKGPARCTLQVHPLDAEDRGLAPGAIARISSRVGSVSAPVEITDGIARGVVSLPHGWGHDEPGARLAVAAQRPGTNSNVLTDELALDPLSGTAVLNGIPVEVCRAD